MDNSINSSNYMYAQCCQYRLPCGYCTKLEKPCPMGISTVPLTTAINCVPTNECKGD